MLLLVKTAAIIPCYCERCLMKHHFTRNVSALETSGILIWSKWLGTVFGQEAVDIGDVVDLCLDAGAGAASHLSYVLLLVFVRATSIHPKYSDIHSPPKSTVPFNYQSLLSNYRFFCAFGKSFRKYRCMLDQACLIHDLARCFVHLPQCTIHRLTS